MAKRERDLGGRSGLDGANLASSVDELRLAALERGGESLATGRHIVTYRESAGEEGLKSLKAMGLSVADSRDFKEHAVQVEDAAGADALMFSELGVAVVGGGALEQRGLSATAEIASDSPMETIEPEYFVFTCASEFLRGFRAATDAIYKGLAEPKGQAFYGEEEQVEPEVLGATWGLVRCKVPPSSRSGVGIKIAMLDTGFDLGHPDFAGRPIISATFVGQPVQDLHGHGTHTAGTACGPKAPPGTTPRYGIGYGVRIYIGKVLSNSGGGTTATVLAGMNWAVANRCEVISMSLGAQIAVQAAYTAAGNAALSKGCLMVAASGNASAATGAPANSPSIMSVASLDQNLAPSNFSNFGKVEIAGPGRDVFSSWPRPVRYKTISGTSMATPHVAGCAALWAQTSPALRGMTLWRKLQATALHLPYPASRVGAGLVQAPP